MQRFFLCLFLLKIILTLFMTVAAWAMVIRLDSSSFPEEVNNAEPRGNIECFSSSTAWSVGAAHTMVWSFIISSRDLFVKFLEVPLVAIKLQVLNRSYHSWVMLTFKYEPNFGDIITRLPTYPRFI